MKGFYSPINVLAEQMARPKGTGAEFMTELSKQPGFKQAEVEDRNLQALQSLPKMARADFIANLKAQRPTMPEEDIRTEGDTHHDEYTLPGGENYREILLQHPHGNYPGVREHFGGAPNVLASMRVKDRTGPEGQKILHIEEIQSDWHKKGGQKGYAPLGEDLYDTAKQAERAYHSLAAKRREASEKSRSAEIALASDKPLYQDPEVRARYTEALKGYNRDIMDLAPQVMKAEEAHRVAEDRARTAVPDAPFKKNWHELALKRMIQHAAQKGYDSIAITPGATQAERWGASEDGAKGFHDLYDKQMPQFLNKFGKQFGAQVQPGYIEKPDMDIVRANAEKHYGEGSDAYNQAMANMRTPVHSFPITPEMREHVVTKGMPLYAGGGEVEEDVPRETVKAYKLFRVHQQHPGKLFPLFIGKHDPVEMGKWTPAEHIPTKGFAERPGWHAGDLPMATHIGEKSDTSLTAPDRRPRNQVWTEIEMPNDVDWQTEANKRGTNPSGRVVPVKAHITDQVPTGGHYRYKTNPNMTGSWLIGGSMKVNRILSDKEVKAINRTAKQADLPRNEPFDPKEFGFAKGGAVKPVVHGIIKERVTVSPNLDAMQYELMSAKRFTKKVK